MRDFDRFLFEHRSLTRRYFLKMGVGASAMASLSSVLVHGEPSETTTPPALPADADRISRPAALGDGVKKSPTLITSQDQFFDVSRGNPIPHTLTDQKKQEVGLTRETWKLEVISDPEHPVPMRKPFTKEKNTPFAFADLMRLAEKHAVRFGKAMTCLNLGCPLGYGIWEGVPLRELIWLTEPRDNCRRVFYDGYHNDDPKQIFRSSLPIGRVFEDPFDLPPVILCYKLNGEWLTPERGGPVRIIVPEAYGFKSIKWLSHIFLTQMAHGNDTYAEQGNDVESPMKTFAATIDVPATVKAGEQIPITGYAQVGISGLSKVQAWIEPKGAQRTDKDPAFRSAPWVDMEILSAPEKWGEELPEGKIPLPTHGFDPATGKPVTWPMRLSLVHWAGCFSGLPKGTYLFRCRSIDEKGIAQPYPRSFRKSGHAAIEEVTIEVT